MTSPRISDPTPPNRWYLVTVTFTDCEGFSVEVVSSSRVNAIRKVLDDLPVEPFLVNAVELCDGMV